MRKQTVAANADQRRGVHIGIARLRALQRSESMLAAVSPPRTKRGTIRVTVVDTLSAGLHRVAAGRRRSPRMVVRRA